MADYLIKPLRGSELRAAEVEAIMNPGAEHEPHRLSPTTSRLAPANLRCRILVAEDTAVNQRLAARILENAGHSLLIARTGK